MFIHFAGIVNCSIKGNTINDSPAALMKRKIPPRSVCMLNLLPSKKVVRDCCERTN